MKASALEALQTPIPSMPVSIVGDLTSSSGGAQARGTLKGLGCSLKLELKGANGASWAIQGGTLTGSFRAEQSFDGGFSWFATPSYVSADGSKATIFPWAAPNAPYGLPIALSQGATHVRLLMVAYTSGSCDAILTANNVGPGYVVSQPCVLSTYECNGKRTSRPWSLSHAFGAAGAKQFLTLHHPAASQRIAKIQEVLFYPRSSSAAVTYLFELRHIITAPTSGNPAITPTKHSTYTFTAPECICLALPTNAGAEDGISFGGIEVAWGITGAGSTVNPPPVPAPLVIYSRSSDAESPLVLYPGVLEGWALVVDASAATTLTGTVLLKFTEE